MTRIDSVLYDLNPIPKSLDYAQFAPQKIQRWPVGELFAEFSGYNTRGYLKVVCPLVEQDNKSIYVRIVQVQVQVQVLICTVHCDVTCTYILSLYICMYVLVIE